MSCSTQQRLCLRTTEKELGSRKLPAHFTRCVCSCALRSVCLVCAGLFMLQCCSAWALRCLTASRFTSVRECYRVNTQTRRRRVKQNCNQRRQTFITLDYFGLFSSEPFYLVFILVSVRDLLCVCEKCKFARSPRAFCRCVFPQVNGRTSVRSARKRLNTSII